MYQFTAHNEELGKNLMFLKGNNEHVDDCPCTRKRLELSEQAVLVDNGLLTRKQRVWRVNAAKRRGG